MPKTIPSGETCWCVDYTPNGELRTTSNQMRNRYSLWLKTENGFEKLSSAKTPLGLEDIKAEYWGVNTQNKTKGRKKNASRS